MSNNTAPKVQRYYVSRLGKVSSAMFDAYQYSHGSINLYDNIDDAQAELTANPPKFEVKW